MRCWLQVLLSNGLLSDLCSMCAWAVLTIGECVFKVLWLRYTEFWRVFLCSAVASALRLLGEETKNNNTLPACGRRWACGRMHWRLFNEIIFFGWSSAGMGFLKKQRLQKGWISSFLSMRSIPVIRRKKSGLEMTGGSWMSSHILVCLKAESFY